MLYTKEKLEKLRHRWTTPKGKKLVKIIRESRCYLSPVLFKSKVQGFPYIADKEVEDSVDLRGIPLMGFDFRSPIKSDETSYIDEVVLISNIHFEGADLKHCNFQNGKIHNCNFESTDLSHAEMRNTTLSNCHFQQAICAGINLMGAKLIECDFNDAIIKNMITGTTIVDQKTNFGRILKSEKDGSMHYASIEYKQIKQIYKNSNLHNLADEFHYKEMVAKRKLSKKHDPKRIANYIFGDLLCKYGTSFIRVMLFSSIIILICAVMYALSGSLYFYNEPLITKTLFGTFFDSVYFSIITFSTVGYGDIHVVGGMRYLAGLESLIGAILLALFTVVIARKVVRD